MYGLLLESLACYIKEKYGEEKWEEIRRAAVSLKKIDSENSC